MNSKELALHRARELDIDRAVRLIAGSGKDESGDRINFYAEWEGCIVRATFGAGTNSASVSRPGDHILRPNYLYKADEYGRYIEIFRYGDWAHRLIERAEEIKALKEADKLIQHAADDAKEIAGFVEIDF